MKRLVAFIGIILLLSSFASAISVTSSAIEKSSDITGNPIASTSDNGSPDNSMSNTDDVDKVCCSITGVYPGAVPSYDMRERSECDDIEDNGELIVGAHREIVSNEFCNDDNDSSNVGEALRKKTAESVEAKVKAVSFCGKSTYGTCQADADCITDGCSGQVCQSKDEEATATTCEWKECYNHTSSNVECACIKNKCMWNRITGTQINKIRQWQNQINVTAKYWNACPSECTCTGSTVKCQLASGRVMTVYAGNSGNVIVQVKGENMSTNVTLYKFGDGVYGVFRNNETKEIRMFPDQVKERIREELKTMLENENVSLEENGVYEYKGEKKVRLFFIIPVRVNVRAEVDPQTGEITKLRAGRWWSFLAKDENPEPLGASCGTVTPGQNDGCCQGRGFDFWDVETQQCELSA